MKQRKHRPLQDELTEAMHSEFTVDAETEQRHRVQTARSTVAMGMFTPAQAAEAYDVPLAEVEAPAS
ncbi:hypothetical protein [Hymenobacter sp. 5414T-23]|uniref:hypothetical protein n=1 Tax=Hymenobacter sp. 5414T-23 TaxID=2932252 RepID=UPI001FCF8EDA|nr:hypothetical protein [Hymenobacter sp. 5414T-23]UOQ83283.1 hypothetical protein MUN83_20925 [Hymenobacter sp. 5414T-23]